MGLFVVPLIVLGRGETTRRPNIPGNIPGYAGANSRFGLLREFAAKGLIRLTVFAAKRRLGAENRRNTRFRREEPGILSPPAEHTAVKSARALEQGAVADDGERRGAARAAFEREFPSGSPGAAFENSGEGELVRGLPKYLAHSGREVIQQHHRQCPPFDDGLALGVERSLQESGLAGLDYAAVQEEAPIAVLCETGQPIEFGDRQSRSGKRFDE
jgi:hypothetical protein